jgi:hypothetical protein
MSASCSCSRGPGYSIITAPARIVSYRVLVLYSRDRGADVLIP